MFSIVFNLKYYALNFVSREVACDQGLWLVMDEVVGVVLLALLALIRKSIASVFKIW